MMSNVEVIADHELLRAAPELARGLEQGATVNYRPIAVSAVTVLGHHPAASVLVDAGAPSAVLAAARALREKWPSQQIVVVGSREAGTHLRMQKMALAGVDDVFFLDEVHEVGRATDAILRAALVTGLTGNSVVPAFGPAGSLGAAATAWVSRNAAFRDSPVAAAASHFGVSARTLERAARDARLPRLAVTARSSVLATVLALREGTDLSMKQIAALLRTSRAALRMKLSRGRE